VLSGAALTVLEVAILAGIAMLFSAFSTPFLSAILTLGFFLIGRNADALARLPVKYFGQPLHDAGVAVAKVVPNLQIYVPARPILSGEAIGISYASYAARAGLMAAVWAILLLSVATYVFKRRDFL
jgi:Cu-processing system permease protein